MASGSNPATAPTPRPQIVVTATGMIAQAWDPIVNNTNTTSATQTIRGTMLGLRQNDVVTNILMVVVGAKNGTAPTTVRLGLLDSTGKVLAVTANLASSAFASVGYFVAALSAPFTIATDGGYYCAVVVNGTWSVTQPTFLIGDSSAPQWGMQLGTNPRRAWEQTGQTDLPAVSSSVTMADPTQAFWFGVS